MLFLLGLCSEIAHMVIRYTKGLSCYKCQDLELKTVGKKKKTNKHDMTWIWQNSIMMRYLDDSHFGVLSAKHYPDNIGL